VPTSSHSWSEPKLDAKRGACEVSTCAICGMTRLRHLNGFRNGIRTFIRVEYRKRDVEQTLSMPGPCRGRT
jgi:hypothetical protein